MCVKQANGWLAREADAKGCWSRRHPNANLHKVFSRLTAFSERALADWESGRRITEPGLRRIKEMDGFQEGLAEVVDAESIPEWLEKPNPAFGDLKPLEVIERGEMDRLWSMILYLESGTASLG